MPLRHPGAFRRVYPAFGSLAAFMSMNIDRHVKAHRELYENLADGELKAAIHQGFLCRTQPSRRVLSRDRAALFRDLRAVGSTIAAGAHPAAIRRTMLFTVEGERDDICAVGQTVAAHDLCGNLRPYLKRHHMQAGVGHYGMFRAERWENQIYPLLKNVILSSD